MNFKISTGSKGEITAWDIELGSKNCGGQFAECTIETGGNVVSALPPYDTVTGSNGAAQPAQTVHTANQGAWSRSPVSAQYGLWGPNHTTSTAGKPFDDLPALVDGCAANYSTYYGVSYDENAILGIGTGKDLYKPVEHGSYSVVEPPNSASFSGISELGVVDEIKIRYDPDGCVTSMTVLSTPTLNQPQVESVYGKQDQSGHKYSYEHLRDQGKHPVGFFGQVSDKCLHSLGVIMSNP